MIDIHSHILPGLDDGAESLEEAIEMARIAESEGIEKIVATPHLFRDIYRYDDLSIIEKKKKELNNVLAAKRIRVEILAGAEVHICHNLINEVTKHRRALSLNKSSYMCVEFPSDHVFSGAKELFFELMSEEVIPIIAHPERNSVFVRNPLLLNELIQMGALAQANSHSFTGIYGRETEEAAFHFIELNLIHIVGSDSHNIKSLAPRLIETVKKIKALKGEEMARALVCDNPMAVIENREIPFLPEPMEQIKRHWKFRQNLLFLKNKK